VGVGRGGISIVFGLFEIDLVFTKELDRVITCPAPECGIVANSNMSSTQYDKNRIRAGRFLVWPMLFKF
jgi:hypothetical protein